MGSNKLIELLEQPTKKNINIDIQSVDFSWKAGSLETCILCLVWHQTVIQYTKDNFDILPNTVSLISSESVTVSYFR